VATTKGSVIVRFLADSNIVQELKKVAAAGGAAVKKLRDKLNGLNNGLSAGLSKGFNLAKKAALAFTAALTAIIVLGARFEKQISEATAVAGGGMEELAAAAREAGATTAYTATQGAEALTNLARAGLGVQGSVDALNPVLHLAGANNLDLAFAAETAAATLKQFQLNTKDATRVADDFTATAANSNTAVEDLSEAMKLAGGVSKGFGLSVEKTLTFMGMMGDLGFRGSIAGTAMANALTELGDVSEKGAKILKKYGLAVEDVNPQVHQLDEVLMTLSQTNMDGLEIMELFGKRAGKPFISLINSTREQIKEGGIANTRFKQLFNTISKSGGKAASQYAAMMNNVSGQTKIAISKMEDLGLSVFDLFKEDLTDALKGFNDWIGENKNEIVAWAGTFIASVLDMLSTVGDFLVAISPVLELIFVEIANIAEVVWLGVRVVVNGIEAAISTLLRMLGDALDGFTWLLDKIPLDITKEWAKSLDGASETLDTMANELAGDAAEGFEDIAASVMEGFTWGEKLSGAMVSVTGTVKSLSDRAGKVSDNVQQAANNVGKMEDKTKSTETAMAGVADETEMAAKSAESFSEKMANIRTEFLDASSFEKMGESLANSISKGVARMKVAFGSEPGGILEKLGDMAETLNAVLPGLGSILDTLINLKDFLAALFNELPQAIMDTLKGIPKLIEENLANFVSFFMIEFQKIFMTFVPMLVAALGKAIVDVPKQMWRDATAEWDRTWENAKDIAGKVKDGLQAVGAKIGIGSKKEEKPEWMKELERMETATGLLAEMKVGNIALENLTSSVYKISKGAEQLADILGVRTNEEFLIFIRNVKTARENMQKGRDLTEEQKKTMNDLIKLTGEWKNAQNLIQESVDEYHRTMMITKETLDGSNASEIERKKLIDDIVDARMGLVTLEKDEYNNVEKVKDSIASYNALMETRTALLEHDREVLLQQREAWKEFADVFASAMTTEIKDQLEEDKKAIEAFWQEWVDFYEINFEESRIALEQWRDTTLSAMDSLIVAAGYLAQVTADNEERAKRLAEVLDPVAALTTDDISGILAEITDVGDLGGMTGVDLDAFAETIITAFEEGGIDESTFTQIANEINRVGELIAQQGQEALELQKQLVLDQLAKFDEGLSFDELSTDKMTTDMIRTMIEQGDLSEAQAAISRLHEDELARLEDERDWQIEQLQAARDEQIAELQVAANAKLSDIAQSLQDTYSLIDDRFETKWTERLSRYQDQMLEVNSEMSKLLQSINKNTSLLSDLAGYQVGGSVPHTGIARVHANEVILTPDQFSNLTQAVREGNQRGSTDQQTMLLSQIVQLLSRQSQGSTTSTGVTGGNDFVNRLFTAFLQDAIERGILVGDNLQVVNVQGVR